MARTHDSRMCASRASNLAWITGQEMYVEYIIRKDLNDNTFYFSCFSFVDGHEGGNEMWDGRMVVLFASNLPVLFFPAFAIKLEAAAGAPASAASWHEFSLNLVGAFLISFVSCLVYHFLYADPAACIFTWEKPELIPKEFICESEDDSTHSRITCRFLNPYSASSSLLDPKPPCLTLSVCLVAHP